MDFVRFCAHRAQHRRRPFSAAVSLCIATAFTVTVVAQQNEPTLGQDGKDVEWVPTPEELIDTMLELAEVTADDLVIDLGSGDGRTVIAAAKLGAQALGVEYDPALVQLSRARAQDEGLGTKASFIEADLFTVSLNDATVITMFLLPDLNIKLRPTLLNLQPGTRIVSNTWDLGDWIADITVQLDPCPGFCTALLWYVPARVEGSWTTGDGRLHLDQNFQYVTGSLEKNGITESITDGRLSGADIVFRVGNSRYQARVSGATLHGMVTTNDNSVPWEARRRNDSQ